MKDIIKLILFFIVFTLETQSQTIKHYPKIGEPVPDFILSDIENYDKNQVSRETLKGQYYILDFWSIGCSTCIASFPKTQMLQDKFRDKLKFVLVGRYERSRNIKDAFRIYKTKYNLSLISTYDSTFYKNVVHTYVPNLLWVDNTGIIKAITGVEAVNESNIEDFISGRSFEFRDESYNASKIRDQNQQEISLDLARWGNRDTLAYLLRSSLILSDPTKTNRQVPEINNSLLINPKRYQMLSASLRELYMVAFMNSSSIYGKAKEKFWFDPQVTPKDSLRFTFENQELFNYSVESKNDMDAASLMKKMQGDLCVFFGYNARIERKMMPYLKLVIVDAKLYKTKISNGGSLITDVRVESPIHTIVNWNINMLMQSLERRLKPMRVAINETGSNDNVTMKIRANLFDLESIRKGLRENGLDLVPSKKYFDVLVIGDPEPIKAEN